jgi:hypothetical protein
MLGVVNASVSWAGGACVRACVRCVRGDRSIIIMYVALIKSYGTDCDRDVTPSISDLG